MTEIKTIYRGDDTDFGGGCLATVTIRKFRSFEVIKAQFRMGAILKEFDLTNVEWIEAEGLNDYVQTTLKINFDAKETKQLRTSNDGYMALFDKEGKKRTAKGSLTIKTNNEVV